MGKTKMSFTYSVGLNWSSSIFNNPTTQSTNSRVTKISDLEGRLWYEWNLFFLFMILFLKPVTKLFSVALIVRLGLAYQSWVTGQYFADWRAMISLDLSIV